MRESINSQVTRVCWLWSMACSINKFVIQKRKNSIIICNVCHEVKRNAKSFKSKQRQCCLSRTHIWYLRRKTVLSTYWQSSRPIYFHKQYSGIPETITREQFHYSNSFELLFSSYVNRSSENFWLYVCESFSNETKVKFTLEGKCSVLHVLSFKVNISEWNISIFSSANSWWRWLGVDSLKVQPHFKNFRVYRLLYNGDCFKSTEGQTFFGILAR